MTHSGRCEVQLTLVLFYISQDFYCHQIPRILFCTYEYSTRTSRTVRSKDPMRPLACGTLVELSGSTPYTAKTPIDSNSSVETDID